MSDFESRLSEALSSGAERAPDASGLAEGARRRWRRRRTTIAVAAAAVVVAVAVPVGVVALNDGGSVDGDRADDPAVPASDTRIETWHDVSVEVPSSWGYGGRSAWCIGSDAETPVVERPGGVVPMIACEPPLSFGVSFGDAGLHDPAYESGHVWQFNETGKRPMYVPGSWLGYWYDGNDLVEVNAGDKATVQAIIDSVHRVDSVDANGCPVMREEGFTTDSEQMSVCRYDGNGELEQSERLSVDDTASAIAALNAAPAGDPEIVASCDTGYAPPFINVDMITTNLNSSVIIQAPCPYKPGITSGGESFQDLTKDVLYWALSPGWSGGLEGDVPLPNPLRTLTKVEPDPTGACPEQIGPADYLSIEMSEGPSVLCRMELSWEGESGGTFLLDEERTLSDAEEERITQAIDAAPLTGALVSRSCARGPGELYLVLTVEQTSWVYNSRCHQDGIEQLGLSSEYREVTAEVLDALGSPYGLLR